MMNKRPVGRLFCLVPRFLIENSTAFYFFLKNFFIL